MIRFRLLASIAVVEKRTALYETHRELGAKMTEFSGFSMPLAYGKGTIEEHLAVRGASGVFDVSHLGTVEVSGDDAFHRLQANLTNDLGKIEPGRTQYTHLLDETGSVVDDIIVWWLDDQLFHVMPNAANTSNVTGAIGGRDITASRVVLAIQGPAARSALAEVAGTAGPAHNRVVPFEFAGAMGYVAGTGYTGGDGVEVEITPEAGIRLFNALARQGVEPCGLGARDTLRLEAGLPLHGHELGGGITPLNANLGWVVAFSKADFPGRAALLRQKERGADPILAGFATGTRQPLRAGDRLLGGDGTDAGWISSGGYSPLRKEGIGLGFVHREALGRKDLAVVRGDRRLPVQPVAYPFVELKSR